MYLPSYTPRPVSRAEIAQNVVWRARTALPGRPMARIVRPAVDHYVLTIDGEPKMRARTASALLNYCFGELL